MWCVADLFSPGNDDCQLFPSQKASLNGAMETAAGRAGVSRVLEKKGFDSALRLDKLSVQQKASLNGAMDNAADRTLGARALDKKDFDSALRLDKL